MDISNYCQKTKLKIGSKFYEPDIVLMRETISKFNFGPQNPKDQALDVSMSTQKQSSRRSRRNLDSANSGSQLAKNS